MIKMILNIKVHFLRLRSPIRRLRFLGSQRIFDGWAHFLSIFTFGRSNFSIIFARTFYKDQENTTTPKRSDNFYQEKKPTPHKKS